MKSLIPPRLRIVGGLVSALVSVLLIAMTLGLIPNSQTAVIEGRARLCETIAINSSVFVSINAFERLEHVLRATIKRDKNILSLGLRDKEGELVIELGKHDAAWSSNRDKEVSDSRVQVPLFKGKENWGNLEIRFKALKHSGMIGFLVNPSNRLIMFVSGSCFIFYLFFLGRVLKQLNPSQVVPQRVTAALDTLAEGLLLMDKNERIVLANKAFSRTVGVDSAKLQGGKVAQLPWFDQSTGGQPESYIWSKAIVNEESPESSTLGLETKEQGKRVFVVHAAPIQGEDSEIRGALASFEDVTPLEQKKAELSEAREFAEEANRAKSDFLARMSHEIRTPMNAIIGFSEVLSRGMDQSIEQRNEYIEKIRSSGNHLLDLINDILDLSKIESGKMELEILECSVPKIISNVANVLRIKAAEKGISLEFSSDGKIPEKILSDPTRLRQILINLVGNAIKFTNKGGVRIVARFEKKSAQSFLVVDVIDSGVGIPEDKLNKIFDAFSQADTTITRHFGGTGLGLSISRQLATALGGDLSVQSVYGEGSIFSVRVKTGKINSTAFIDLKMDARDFATQTTHKKSISSKLNSVKILVADDGESNRDLIQLILERAGAEVVSVENGREALDKVQSQRFDSVLLDMEMPVMDGYTAAGEMRKLGLDLPIFALTAHAMKGAEERCLNAGCSGYLTKPIEMDEVISVIAKTVNKSKESESKIMEKETLKEDKTDCEFAESTDSDQDSIVSSLSGDDPFIEKIIEKFTSRLHQDMTEISNAWVDENFDEVREIAHRIKGSGGTAGFDILTKPAGDLELAARDQNKEELEVSLAILNSLVRRIRVSNKSEATTS